MKKLIKRILLFLIPFLLIGFLLDVFVSKRMRMIYFPSGEHEVWNDIYSHKITEPCLIYGSSRAKTHLNPMMIENSTNVAAYNFGMDGQSFDTQYLRHKINIKENGYPKCIIYCLDLFSLDKTKDVHNKQQYLPYMLWNVDIMKTLSGYEDFHPSDHLIPSVRYFGHYDSFKRAMTESFESGTYVERTKGFVAIQADWQPEEIMKIPKKHYQKINASTYALYEEFIQECQDNNVSLAMVYAPEFENRRETVINRDSVMSLYQQLSEKYDVPFLDYTADSMSLDVKYYADALHFNQKGSVIFTQKVIKDLSEIGFFSK